MPGIYIHIPYCHKACHYCNFHFSTNLKTINSTVEAICHEAGLVASEFSQVHFVTLYIGGGTPSLLHPGQLKKILHSVRENFRLTSQETTLEANPEDLLPEKLEEWLGLGIDRLSIGIQTFDEQFLRQFNRNHTSQQAFDALKQARRAGFLKYNVDLIFGFPGQSMDQWLSDLHRAIDLQPQHLSVYSLTREEGTAFDYMVRRRMIQEADEGLMSEMFFAARELLTSTGYQQYEISNYALPGYHALHNSNYWKGEPYIGLGPSAHSYTGTHRRWNISNNALYEKSLANGEKWYEEELLTPEIHFNELVITGIRTIWGIDMDRCLNLLRDEQKDQWLKKVDQLIEKNQLKKEKNHIILHPDYLFISDRIAIELMV